MNTKGSSPDAQAAGENDGPGAPNHDAKAVREAHKVSAVAKSRVAKKNKSDGGGGFIRNTFATSNQQMNIFAMVIAGLLFMLLIAEVGAFVRDKQEIFIEYAKPILAILTGIIAYVAGRGSRSH